MTFSKRGLIFTVDGRAAWSVSHAQIPTADPVSGERIRVYFGTRDRFNRTVTSYVELSATDPQRILHVHDRPVLGLGELGCFDDSGAMSSWIVGREQGKFLYYTGWNRAETVSYRLAIGLAISVDGGVTFERYSTGPLLDRNTEDPCWVAAPCVIPVPGGWRMYYIACTHWSVVHGHPEPHYIIKVRESEDGLHWRAPGRVCIHYDDFADAFARPCVYPREAGGFGMLFSYRSARDYRTDKTRSYRIGLATSADGLAWERQEDPAGLERSPSGWDSEMMAYTHLLRHAGTSFLFYNGNGFGRSGFGYAIATSTR
ncbi:MAG: hypothetical protein AB1486_07840 [Planctomycetota bacterium]